MSDTLRGRRGEPLLMLAALLLAWGTWRAAAWQDPFSMPVGNLLDSIAEAPATAGQRPDGPDRRGRSSQHSIASLPRGPVGSPIASPRLAILTQTTNRLFATQREFAPSAPSAPSAPFMARPLAARLPAAGGAVDADEIALGPAAQLPNIATARVFEQPVPQAAFANPRRITGEAWLLVRDGSASAGAAPAASYGGSQAGAIMRYRFGGSPAAPSAFVRTSGGLAGIDRPELALGLSARPFANVPVTAHAELRARDQSEGGIGLAPAAFVTAGHSEADLPGGIAADAYVQAGYVGGDFATGFIDGNARLTKPMVAGRGVRVAAAAGLWGGAQRGAARLDVGPGLTAETAVAGTPLRLSVDYRLRVAGNAAPDSGPVVTLSTGF